MSEINTNMTGEKFSLGPKLIRSHAAVKLLPFLGNTQRHSTVCRGRMQSFLYGLQGSGRTLCLWLQESALRRLHLHMTI